jgi:predicted metal-dependent peptidase
MFVKSNPAPKPKPFDDPTAAGRILGYDKFEGTSETAVRLMLRVPYIMVLYYSLTFYTSKVISTLAVNGVACWINPSFWAQLSRDQRLTAIAHEIGHKMLLHPTRRGARDPILWNIAGDYVINLMLVESGFVPLANLIIDGMPWSWLYDIKYQGMTTEQVYDALLKEIDDEEGEEEGESGDEEGEEAGDGSGKGRGNPTRPGKGKGKGNPDDSADGESASDTSAGDDGEGSAGDTEDGGGNGVRPRRSRAMAKAEAKLGPMRDLLDFGTDPEGNRHEDPERGSESAEEFEERMKQELNAAEAVAKMQGKVPGWMQRVLTNAQHQKVPWPEVLEQYLKSMVQADYSWRRFNKREYCKIGILTPDMYEPAMGGIVLFVDCSGSIGARDLGIFGGHFRDVLEQVRPKWVEVVYFDTQSYAPFDRFERAEFSEDTSRLKPKGGGGTSFEFFARHIEDMDEQPEVAMCFTDMYGPFGPEPSVPMIWLSNSSVEKAPHGAVIGIA